VNDGSTTVKIAAITATPKSIGKCAEWPVGITAAQKAEAILQLAQGWHQGPLIADCTGSRTEGRRFRAPPFCFHPPPSIPNLSKGPTNHVGHLQ
jgi:hypothetical protein